MFSLNSIRAYDFACALFVVFCFVPLSLVAQDNTPKADKANEKASVQKEVVDAKKGAENGGDGENSEDGENETAPAETTDGDVNARNSATKDVSKLDSGDTAWILTATALVLFMTIPGLALFYGGLVRSKNILSVLMHCLIITAIASIIWVLFGYSLAFDTSNAADTGIGLFSFLGGYEKVCMGGMRGNVEGSIPELLLAAFQMTFAIITPALIIGAFAERMKFIAVVLFSAIWLVVVYLPICHMTWAETGLFYKWGAIDLAGGIVVHITAGFAALVACIMVGPRKGYPNQLEPPHSTVLTLIGTGMLWVGWFGFNAGSHLHANDSAAMTLLVTHISASIATIVWMAIEWVKFGKPSVLGAATGSIAGLAAITPASGEVGPMGALAIGAASGAICFFFATKVKKIFRYDDSLDVFGVHGIGGLIGTILVGIFAAKSFGGNGFSEGVSMGRQLGVQLGAAAITAGYTVLATIVILLFVKMVVGLRVSEEVEVRGLDLGEHEERGYIH